MDDKYNVEATENQANEALVCNSALYQLFILDSLLRGIEYKLSNSTFVYVSFQIAFVYYRGSCNIRADSDGVSHCSECLLTATYTHIYHIIVFSMQ